MVLPVNKIVFIYDNINEIPMSNEHYMSFFHPENADSEAVTLIKRNGIFVVSEYIQSDFLISPYIFIKPIKQLCGDASSPM